MYIYTSQLPGFELQLFRCLNCGRGLFKASAEAVVIANISGMNHLSYEPGAAYFEHQCHAKHNIVYFFRVTSDILNLLGII